jgi:hypothetical protein
MPGSEGSLDASWGTVYRVALFASGHLAELGQGSWQKQASKELPMVENIEAGLHG